MISESIERLKSSINTVQKTEHLTSIDIIVFCRARFLKGLLALIHESNFVPFLYFTFTCIA